MKKYSEFTLLNRILVGIIIALLITILAGTIIGLVKKNSAESIADEMASDPEPTPQTIENLNKINEEQIDAYSGLGTLRLLTAPDPDDEEDSGSVLIVTPWFSYPKGDTVFYEELSRKRILISGIITNYFLERTEKELRTIAEEKIKADLMDLINGQLSLGKISKVYFTDYIFL